MNNNLTINERATLAQGLTNDISTGTRGFNYYLAIGQNMPWMANDTLVPDTGVNSETTDSINQIYKNMVAMKLINPSEASNVIRRNDWVVDTIYTAYTNSVPMFSTTLLSNANGTITFNSSGSSNSSILVDDIFTVGVANQNTFTLTSNTSNTNFILLTLNGITLTPNADYNLIGNTGIVLSSNAHFGDIVEAKIFSPVFSTIIVYDQFNVNVPVQNTFLLTTNTSTSLTIVTINGISQTPNLNYQIVGNNSLVLAANVFNGDIVEAKIFSAVPSAVGNSGFGATTVIGNNTTFLLDFALNDIVQLPGDGITIFPQQREIISITSNNIMSVNLAFTGNIIANTPQFVSNTYPNFAYQFYVRNTFDQVFVCLGNNSGGLSTTMPIINVGGDLPTSPYIITSDGYYWKYLYTMSAGQKQLFFTPQWMPVSTDTNVLNSAVDGRLDVINILNPGTGYNSNTPAFSAPIITVIGDGTGANLTAQVNATGSIIGINVLNGGQDYTYATVTANTGVNGSNAVLQAVIGPPGGWGSNNLLQLGCTTSMVSVLLNDTESGTIPTVDVLGDFFQYRQISIIKSPELVVSGNVASALNYDLTTMLPLPGNTAFAMNDVIFQSSNGNITAANFVANVVYFDISTFNLHINNITGVFAPGQPIYSTNTSLVAVTFNEVPPLINFASGSVEYVENRLAVQRSPGQTENLKIIIGF